MKKKLFLLTLILATLMLSGCEHTHKYKWVVDKEATESETGLTHKECEKCGAISDENTVISTFDCKPVYEDWYVDGDMQPKPPLFDYQIYVEKNRYSYEQEFEIHINNIIPEFSYANALLAGELSIRLEESPYYEIIGQNEYLVSEFNPTDVDRLNFTFKIKATYPCDSPEYFVFKIKCPYDKEMVEKKFPYPENVNCNFDEEYFFTIKDLLYINDHNGMTIGGFEDLYRRESNIYLSSVSPDDLFEELEPLPE